MKIFGAINVISGALVAAIPYFNNCFYEGKLLSLANGRTVPMKCYWTAQAEIAIGLSLLVVGIMMLANRGGLAPRSMGIMGMVLGAFAILLPTALIGVCSDMTASCNLVMRPAMILVGAVAMAGSLGSIMVSQRRMGPAL